jgi:hypothetical protein
MHQHYVLTESPQLHTVLEFIDQHDLQREVHINRVRFWLPSGELYVMFLLKFSDCCPLVDLNEDLATGDMGFW